jgi:hypothetical protein
VSVERRPAPTARPAREDPASIWLRDRTTKAIATWRRRRRPSRIWRVPIWRAADLSSVPDLAPPNDLAICVPTTCSDGMCGEALDGCGSKITCGDCHGDEMTCGAGGPNRCGKGMCHPLSCMAIGAQCGLASDSCAHVLDCGHCPGGQTCLQNHCV